MKLTQAIILAGGRGERLRPLTTDRPKPMISVSDRPLLAYTLQWLHEAGIQDVVISCGYRHDVICDYFKDGSDFGVNIQYSIEDKPLGRGGGIKLASHLLRAEPDPILVANGDVITDFPLADLLREHTKYGAPATVVTVPLRSPYGIADIGADGLIREFREKPELPFWINAGIYLLNREVLARFPENGDHEVTLFPQLAAEGGLRAFQFRGFWRTIDTAKDLGELQQELEKRPPLRARTGQAG
jgi:NDP-sugar pyrophosphorylase family protein